MPTYIFGLIAAVCSGALQFVLFLRWLHRRMRDDEISRVFVRDMALIHLPHIYAALQQIAVRQGIDLAETPVVHFSDVNGHARRR